MINVLVQATSVNRTLVPAGEIQQQQQMDVFGVFNNHQGVVSANLVDRSGVKIRNSDIITKAFVVASQVDSGQQLNSNDVGNESATSVRFGITDMLDNISLIQNL
ncbi:hypothetical protein RDI58_017729 [Solanum bulbocastanum]|uniref:Uncharacterized protein n=1 Tax=Solanum bulbocastanum TaxID=147425 RepID=A0AAN8TBU0_SOLBU